MKKITIIGGGTGTYVVASLLKTFPYEISKIVAVFDTGGSTGRLRDEFGFLPVGDLRQSLAALAPENHHSWIKELLLYRFSKGDGLEGHNLGNLLLTALQDMTGSTPKALEVATQIFKLKGSVFPITTDSSNLKVTFADGTQVIGEHALDEPKYGGRKIAKLELTESCQIYEAAQKCIINSDYIIIGPGDLYASILPNLIVTGAGTSFRQTTAKIIYIVNLMTRYTQTHNFTALDHVRQIEKYLTRPVDYVIVNNGAIKPDILKKYAKNKEYPVVDDTGKLDHGRVIYGDFGSQVETQKVAGDQTVRSLMRHDQQKLTQALLSIIENLTFHD